MECYELVSAIITTHKREPELVLRAVQSILDQTYQNLEIIVVDDSPTTFLSREKVAEKLNDIKDKRFKYIQHEINQGACVARNTGIDASAGNYVAFLDDDDVWHKDKIEKQVQKFLQGEYGLVYCNAYEINEIKGTKKVMGQKFYRGYIFAKLLEQNFIGSTSFPLIKKQCLNECGGFDETLQASQDYDLWLRIAEKHAVEYIDEPLVDYYIHEGDAISKDSLKTIQGAEVINKKYQGFLSKNPKILSKKYSYLAIYYLREGLTKISFSHYIKSIKLSPFDFKMHIKFLVHCVLRLVYLFRRNNQNGQIHT